MVTLLGLFLSYIFNVICDDVSCYPHNTLCSFNNFHLYFWPPCSPYMQEKSLQNKTKLLYVNLNLTSSTRVLTQQFFVTQAVYKYKLQLNY